VHLLDSWPVVVRQILTFCVKAIKTQVIIQSILFSVVQEKHFATLRIKNNVWPKSRKSANINIYYVNVTTITHFNSLQWFRIQEAAVTGWQHGNKRSFEIVSYIVLRREKRWMDKTILPIKTHLNRRVCVRVRVSQFCVSDVGTLSTLITPGVTSSITEPAAGTSGRSACAESAPADKPGRVVVT